MLVAALRSRPYTLAAASACAATTALATSSDNRAACAWWSARPKVHLKYFDVPGVAETIRHIMALGDIEWTESKWKVDFSKVDMSNIPKTLPLACPEFGAAKENGELVKALGRAPVIIVDGKHTVAQSKTIERYLSRRLGLLGASEEEAADIDMVTEHVRDIKDKYQKAKADKDKEKAVAEFFDETMPGEMLKLEQAVLAVGAGGTPLVGKALSYADVTLFVFLLDFFDNKQGAMAAIDKCPRLQASIKAVGEVPSIVKYRAARK